MILSEYFAVGPYRVTAFRLSNQHITHACLRMLQPTQPIVNTIRVGFSFGQGARTPKWLSTAGNQFNSWGFPQVPHSGPGLCRTEPMSGNRIHGPLVSCFPLPSGVKVNFVNTLSEPARGSPSDPHFSNHC
jgi:hypothetical protein